MKTFVQGRAVVCRSGRFVYPLYTNWEEEEEEEEGEEEGEEGQGKVGRV